MADRLEQEYQGAVATGQWQCKVVLTSGDWVMLHSPEVMMHFPVAAALAGALDDWGQVSWRIILSSMISLYVGLYTVLSLPLGAASSGPSAEASHCSQRP